MPTIKEAIDEAVQNVLDTAVQFREVEQDETHGTWTRAAAWSVFNAALMQYHVAETVAAQPTHRARELDGEACWCACGYTPVPGWGITAQRMLVANHQDRAAGK